MRELLAAFFETEANIRSGRVTLNDPAAMPFIARFKPYAKRRCFLVDLALVVLSCCALKRAGMAHLGWALLGDVRDRPLQIAYLEYLTRKGLCEDINAALELTSIKLPDDVAGPVLRFVEGKE
jgi:hypothetical protein